MIGASLLESPVVLERLLESLFEILLESLLDTLLEKPPLRELRFVVAVYSYCMHSY